MLTTKYLILGSSHAGLSAAEEIRVNDQESSLTMVTMEDLLPYSPTALPYIVSEKVTPDKIYLRDMNYFEAKNVHFIRGKAVTAIDSKRSTASLVDGTQIGYEKLLVATGAQPTVPRVEGLDRVPFLELRTMADAFKHLDALRKSKSAIVMGTGLVGMHAAENFAHRGMKVAVVRARAKKNPRILPNYFDEECSRMIQDVFEAHGVRFYLEDHAVRVSYEKNEFALTLLSGDVLKADLLLACTGIKPRISFLKDSGVAIEEGVIVDSKMRTTVDNLWAAGDVAQADDFFNPVKILNAILPDAVLQGKIAGGDMSGGRLESDYLGGISMNTFNFFGHRAFSVGISASEDEAGCTINKTVLPSAKIYQKMIFKETVLAGLSAINSDLDPGIIMNLVKRKANLKEEMAEFVSNPVQMSRRLMWRDWR